MYAELMKAVEEKTGEEVIFRTVFKNGTFQDSFTIGSGNIRPTIYLKNYDCENIEETSEQIASLYEETKASGDMEKFENIGELVRDKEFVKTHIIPCLRKKGTTEENSITFDFLDMDLYFRLFLDDFASIEVKNWFDFEPEDLKAWAIANVSDEKYSMRTMFETLVEMSGGEPPIFIREEDCPQMFIISNKVRTYGAGFLTNTDFLNSIAKMFENDFYILPSSIHECIVLPYSKDIEVEELNKMIKEVNVTQVAEPEVLSDHAYFFDRETQALICE